MSCIFFCPDLVLYGKKKQSFLQKWVSFFKTSDRTPLTIEGQEVDVGGPTFFYLKNIKPKVKFIDWHRVREENQNIDECIPPDLQSLYRPFYNDLFASDFLAHKCFFHYPAGSNWNGMTPELIHQKTLFFEKIMELAFKGERS